MVLYIDKENLIELVRSLKKAGNAEFSEYSALVRKNMDIHYNFPKDEIKANEELSLWFSMLGSGIGGTNEFCPPEEVKPERPMKANFYNSLGSNDRSAIFFLNDEAKCTAAAEKRCVIVSKIGDELNKLKEVFDIDNNGEILAYQIKDWCTYLPQVPLSDIIICDNHYFKDKRVYDANDNELIRTLSSIPQKAPVNVVIILKEKEVDHQLDLATEQVKIKEIVKKASGSTQSTVTILTTYSTHDRSLITNYYRIKQGCSFHLKENGIKKDVSTEVKTHAVRKNHEFTSALLAEYQKIAYNPVNCFGDKVSNYLKFK